MTNNSNGNYQNENDFLIERYKYILQRKRELNECTFKITAIYQAILLSLSAAFYSVFTNKDLSIHRVYFCDGIVFLLITSTIFIILLLISGISSWCKYRRDENDILIKVTGMQRNAISLKNVFGWYETYLILAIFSIAVAILIYYCTLRDNIF